jgi:hypothetical protein
MGRRISLQEAFVQMPESLFPFPPPLLVPITGGNKSTALCIYDKDAQVSARWALAAFP